MSKIVKWSEHEKMCFLANVLFTNCPTASLDKVELPEGRTKKACTHVLQSFKSEYFNKYADGSATGNKRKSSSAESSPRKKTSQAKVSKDCVKKEEEETAAANGEDIEAF